MTTGTTRSQLSAFWDRRAFSVSDADFFWLDIAMAAMARGEWAGFERRLAEGLACAARAAALNAWPADDVIDEAGDAFRYQRDLIAGSDLKAWLDSAGLSTADWMSYLQRETLRRTSADSLEDILDEFAPSPRQLEAATVAEGLCSGIFDLFERSFSGRVAVVFEADAAVLPTLRQRRPGHEAPAARLARQHGHWFSMREEVETRARLEIVLALEEGFDALAERLATGDRLRGVVEANRLEWVAVDLDAMSFATEDAAREAVLCVREDGLSLHDVAGLSRVAIRRTSVFLEDVPKDHRDRLVSASPGQVLGPLAVDGHFEVTAVVGRTLPSLDDARVAARARQAAIDRAVEHAARALVKR